MTPARALAQLESLGDAQKAQEMAAYHKAPRRYLGVANPVLDALAKDWRNEMDVEGRVALADALWRDGAHEARVLAAKLLTQARLRPSDDSAWQLITSWAPGFDAWAVADHACIAGQKRLVWAPARIADIAHWHLSDHMWTRRAALVMTLPWTKQNHPKPADLAIREQVLGWAASYVEDHDWFIQKAVAWWLRELSKHDPDRTRAFLAQHGPKMKPFAQKEAARKLA
ncbi:MAG: DNA alkylation repair protein [Pseudomonadota bacterium]